MKSKHVACCTANGVLHLFTEKDDFRLFLTTHEKQIGLVCAWIDAVVDHGRQELPLTDAEAKP